VFVYLFIFWVILSTIGGNPGIITPPVLLVVCGFFVSIVGVVFYAIFESITKTFVIG
jgi:hypothetical protein